MPLEATFKARDSQPWDPARVETNFRVEADFGISSVGRIEVDEEVTV